MAWQFETTAPLDFGLEVRASILVVFKLKRGRAVLPRREPWRGKVVLPHLPLWRGKVLKLALYYVTLVFLDQEILLLQFHDSVDG
jgi:hypothetical protein